ncbi:hypothetical protein NC651_024478 [Populus alba x Populus x berolinensis]|nr:hypothetical protein NC651_024477 [Populus alba x Populus x berolinensis]KAJ6890979.1 hypothetical protein NC651_024478 [Populus alba x Populus x berolinensis]
MPQPESDGSWRGETGSHRGQYGLTWDCREMATNGVSSPTRGDLNLIFLLLISVLAARQSSTKVGPHLAR